MVALELTGKKFNRLTALHKVSSLPVKWSFRCDCGVEIVAVGRNVSGGHTKSCGCLKIEVLNRPRPHLRKSPEHKRKVRLGIHLRHKYGITLAERDNLMAAQNGKCALSGCVKSAEDVDHCHATGKVRGLLCHQHNYALGLFGDSPSLLKEAAAYVERHGA